MSSIVIELQRSARDPKGRVSDLLRDALIVARKLRLAAFEAWINQELNGYGDAELPDYRKVRGVCRVFNPYNGMYIPIQFENLATEVRYSYRHLGSTIAELEDMMSKPKPPYLISYSHADAKRLMENMRDAVGMHLPLPAPCLMITHGEVVGIVDAVRTEVLNWSLKLEEEGILGEGFTFSPAEKETAARVYHNTTINIQGSVTNSQIQQGSPGGSQSLVVGDADLEDVARLIEVVSESVAKLGLNNANKQKLEGEVEKIKAQLASTKPKRDVIAACLGRARELVWLATVESMKLAITGEFSKYFPVR